MSMLCTNINKEQLLNILDEGILVFDTVRNLEFINKSALITLCVDDGINLHEIIDAILKYKWFDMDGLRISAKNHPIVSILNNKHTEPNIAGFKNFCAQKTTWIKFNQKPFSEGKLVITTQDITNYVKHSIELKGELEVQKQICNYSNQLYDCIPYGLCKIDRNGSLHNWNSSSSKILELNQLPITIQDFFNMIEIEEQESKDKTLEKPLIWFVQNNIIIEDLAVVYRKNGIKKYLTINIFPIADSNNEVMYSVLSFKNVSNTKVKLEQAKTQNHFIREIFDTLDVPIAVVSHPDLKYEIVNRNKCLSLSKLLGRTLEEKDIVGKYVKDIAPFIFEKGVCDIALLAGYTRETVILDNVEYVSPDGVSVFQKLFLCPVFNENNTVTHIASVGIDLTDQIIIQNKMQELSKAKEEFFSVVSHELRTPINVILSAEKVINSMIYNPDENNLKKIQRWLKMVRQNSLRLLKLVNNILDLSKIDAGYLQASKKNVDFVALVKKIYDSIAPFVEQKGLSIKFRNDVKKLVIAVDDEKIERVIFNLVSNAVKYNKEDGKIEISLLRDQQNVYIQIRDTGIGIPNDKLDIIFERFLQVNSSLSRHREGAGIGLSLCKAIAHLHNGDITVESKLNEGSTFTLKLPIVKNDDSCEYETQSSSNYYEIANIELSDIYSI